MPFVEFDDNTKIHYIKKGKGQENIIFIHGNLANTLWWEKALNAMPDKYTGYAFDLPGSGKSPETGKRHTIDYFVEILENFVNALSIETFYLVGHSMGGGISQLYAINYPEKVKKILLLDSMAADGFHVLYERGINILERMRTDLKLLSAGIRNILPKCEDEDFIEKAIQSAINASEQVFIEQAITMHEANWIDRLNRIKCPVLFLHGELDDFVPKDGSERTAYNISDCTFKYLENCGHSPNVEIPDIFHKELFAFLEK